jgi:2-polyprenyl-3-methyl-5-hydroxy-6-metoxy-1,4-benzoquinol methylase
MTDTMTATMQETRPSAGPAESFDERFVRALNDAAMVLSCSIGHRTGLFDAIPQDRFALPAEIAERAGLDPRYVREWLGAMATGGVVEVDSEDRFRLPPERAAFLTRAAGDTNLAVFAQYVPLLGAVEDDIVACFRNGGGVPYERFPRFHEVMAEDSAMTVLSALEGAILPLVPGLVDRMEEGIRALDVGCGRGRAVLSMAERFPRSEFIGFDLSEDAIGWARSEAARRGLSNARFEVRDASDLDRTAEPDAFDLVTTFDAVHDQAEPRAVLRGIARTLRTDGVYLMQDIHAHSDVHRNLEHPLGPFLYTISTMHCTTVSLAQGGEGLGTMWGRERAQELLREAGFREIAIHRLEHDIQNDYYVVRR